MEGPFWSAAWKPSSLSLPLQPRPHSCCCNPAAHSLLWQCWDAHSDICFNPGIRNQQPGSGAPREGRESLRWQSSRTAGPLNTACPVCSTCACNDFCQFLPDTINAIDYFSNMACYKKKCWLLGVTDDQHSIYHFSLPMYWKMYLTSTKLLKKKKKLSKMHLL